jgi:hypothetical protein
MNIINNKVIKKSITTIAVCGDSYCVADTAPEREHFSQVLEDRYNYKIIPLALAGCSNVCIAFQIKKALELEVDAIIYNMTFPSRVDIILDSSHIWLPAGLKNFVYPFVDNAGYGSEHVGKNNSPIFSTVPDLLEEKLGLVKNLKKEHIDAVKSYFLNFYNHLFKQEIDSWILAYWHHQILQHNKVAIPLINNSSIKTEFDPTLGQAIYDFTKLNQVYPKVYHTDAQTQSITADRIHQHIKNLTKVY